MLLVHSAVATKDMLYVNAFQKCSSVLAGQDTMTEGDESMSVVKANGPQTGKCQVINLWVRRMLD